MHVLASRHTRAFSSSTMSHSRYPSDRDREEHRAVTAAANYLRQHPVRFPGGHVPSRPSEIAVLAVKSYEVFLEPPATDPEICSAIVEACRSFDRHSSI